MERKLGQALEEVNISCDLLAGEIETEKKNLLISFLKYGADGGMSEKVIEEYNDTRDDNFNFIINSLAEFQNEIDCSFINARD